MIFDLTPAKIFSFSHLQIPKFKNKLTQFLFIGKKIFRRIYLRLFFLWYEKGSSHEDPSSLFRLLENFLEVLEIKIYGQSIYRSLIPASFTLRWTVRYSVRYTVRYNCTEDGLKKDLKNNSIYKLLSRKNMMSFYSNVKNIKQRAPIHITNFYITFF